MSKLLNTQNVADMLGVPIATLRYWIQNGDAPESFILGRRRMFRADSVEAFIDAKEQAERAKVSA